MQKVCIYHFEGGHSICFFLKSIALAFLHGYKISMRNDHRCRDSEYSWNEYIQT